MIERRLGSRAAEGLLGEQEPGLDGPTSASDEGSRGRVTSGPRRRRVLFALTELEYPTPTLRRVAAVATAIEGGLFILRVLSPTHAMTSRSFAERSDEIDAERARLAERGTIAWWRRTLLASYAEGDIQVRIGEFATEVSAHARLLGAACVVLAPAPAGRAGTMTALMRACRQPVFHTPAAGQEWAALLMRAKATDLR
jgi:hypothetical protein